MPKTDILISGLPDRDARIIMAMASFRELQNDYEACLTTANPISPLSIKAVATFYYIVSSTLSRRLAEQTQPLKDAHTHRQRLTEAKEASLAK
jgi:hypothetical protein